MEPDDARAIIMHVLHLDSTAFMLKSDEEIPKDLLDVLEQCRQRRENGEPVAYIVGERGFYRSVFKVSKDTLIPRADTEILVEDAIHELESSGKTEIKLLDMCCGTGCIGISVAKALAEKGVSVSLTLSDISEGALEVCRQNVVNLITEKNITVKVMQGDLFGSLKGEVYDAVLSNPPYIPQSIIPNLERQVQFEPIIALDGGKDGLDFVKMIASGAKAHLAPDGLLMMETGYDQGVCAPEILRGNGYLDVAVLKDLEGCDRVVKGRK